VDANSISALSMLPVDFPNAQLHFHHFVKVHELKAIEMERLVLLHGRGAAVLCGNNHRETQRVGKVHLRIDVIYNYFQRIFTHFKVELMS
jgi:hypothetical protein